MYLSFQDLVKDLLCEEYDEFCNWAFGKDYESLDGEPAINIWNDKRKDQLELFSTGFLIEDLPKMIKIWRDENES